jgi:diphthine-ammonia ligase
MNKAAILWTGGKDSALAFFKGVNEGYSIERLITFVPPNPIFLAHPLEIV